MRPLTDGLILQESVFQLPACPGVALPVAAAFVLAEPDGWACPPIVLMHNHAGRWWVRVSFVRVPANIALAHDGGRRTNACDREQASTEGSAKYDSSESQSSEGHLRISIFSVSEHAR